MNYKGHECFQGVSVKQVPSVPNIMLKLALTARWFGHGLDGAEFLLGCADEYSDVANGTGNWTDRD
jgi:hypothetical protein